MPTLGVVVLLALAAFRLTRLITDDTFTLALRDRLYDWAWDEDHPVVDERTGKMAPASRGAIRAWVWGLFDCPWCLGVWVAAGVYSAWRWGGEPGDIGVVIAAVAGVQGVVAQFAAMTEQVTKAAGMYAKANDPDEFEEAE